jgi:hypothetical protein
MKTIALIARSIFPTQTPRSMRATNLAIALAEKGYHVNIYCLKGKYDYSEFENKYSVKVNDLGQSRLGNGNSDSGTQSKNILFKIIRRLFGKLIMFPELEISYMIYKNRKLIQSNDSYISIAIPYAIHFGMINVVETGKIWISDCGDPFIGNPIYSYPSYFKWLQNKWVKKTTFITIPTEKAIPAYPSNFKDKIRVIPQGFPITYGLDKNYSQNSVPTFCYSGNIYLDNRNPTFFLNYLSELTIDFKFIVYTKHIMFFSKFKEKLKDKLIINDFIPREDLLIELSKMDFLINFKNDSEVQVPSKLIDYYMVQRPILEISSTFDEQEKKEFKNFVQFKFNNKIKHDVTKYDINNVADKFIDLLINR